MNHNYESVKETMITKGIDIPESYIEKSLEELGFKEFPKFGLSDIGLSKLVKTAIDIYHSEIDLTPRKQKRESKLENSVVSIVKEDLKKVGKFIIYPTIGVNFALPTMIRKEQANGEEAFFSWTLFTIENLAGYITLICNNPKLIPSIAGVQIITNIVSKIYEQKRKKDLETEYINNK